MILWVYCLSLTGIALGHSPQIRAEPLFNAGSSTSTCPINVHVTYNGTPVKGYLQWQNEPRIRHRIPLRDFCMGVLCFCVFIMQKVNERRDNVRVDPPLLFANEVFEKELHAFYDLHRRNC